ncbi:somatomedin-B and thrombospondin type-1 domain-containing protein-like [Uloborus diversus]|uniref:somatomedin-B and thrombospondin type-1 domain-containing protein-like n=1 Tax=Uloborus diversus TaxID=327109 RepID=UPI00240A1597|nr:somatomedin-B and thrombospondin type-1 domain-containing protein-like [Uloborus diversus]
MEVRLLITVLLVACFRSSVAVTGSCRAANLCCVGRDPSCAVHSHLISSNSLHSDIQANDQDRPCYCDHACVKVGDCCPDYQRACGVSNCEVSGWGPWSACSVDCGTGVMSRERHVIREATNGGEGCPELHQKRTCLGSRCDGAKQTHVKANRETAMILPASYSSIRHISAEQDIRSNLRLKYRKDPAEVNSKPYCVTFEVTKVKKSCEGNELYPKFTKGARVCVVCETAAMRKHLGYRCQGHGVEHKSTRFTYLPFSQCHGRWKKLETSEKCNCNQNGDADFIFV